MNIETPTELLSRRSVPHLVEPRADGFLIDTIQKTPLFPVQGGVTSLQRRRTAGERAASGSGERNDGLARQVVAFDECIDDARSKVPPDRITDEDDIVIGDVLLSALECGRDFGSFISTELRDCLSFQSRSVLV